MKKYIGQHIFDYVASFRQNVGIGTDTPNRQLQVKKTTGTASIAITSSNTGTSQLELGGTSDNDIAGISYSSNTQKLFLKTNNTGQLYIDNSGNVGIGLTSPSEKLHVSGNAIITGDLTVSGTTTTINTANLNVEDKNITINYSTGDSSSTADGAGITIQDAVDSSTDATILWDATTDRFDFSNDIQLPDNKILNLGSGSADLQLLHDGNNSHVVNYTGDLKITNNANDKDIIFNCDDGSGGNTAYITIDGSTNRVNFNKPIKMADSTKINVGSGLDLQLVHDSFDSYINNFTGNLNIVNRADDKDIIFQSDDGSGNVTEYFRLDGSALRSVFLRDFLLADSVKGRYGSSGDLEVYHNGTDSVIDNVSGGDLYISQKVADKDLIFRADDGSGGFTTYFQLDGSATRTIFSKQARFSDNVHLTLGDGGDLELSHDGSISSINNYVGNLNINQHLDDGDIRFKADDGSGGITDYMTIDGSHSRVVFSNNIKAAFGSSSRFVIFHDGTDATMRETQGDLKIINTANDKDIIFQSDDGSGSTTTYMYLDGSITETRFSKATRHSDSISAKFGDGNDMNIYSDGTNGVISVETDNADLVFRGDNGSGGTDQYFRVDGGEEKVIFNKPVKFDYDVLTESNAELNLDAINTTGSGTVVKGGFLNPATEAQAVHQPQIVNDLAGFFKWGTIVTSGLFQTRSGSSGSFSYSNEWQASNANWNRAFDSTSSHPGSFFSNNGVDGNSVTPGVIELQWPTEITYSLNVGIVFGSNSFTPTNVKIEAYKGDGAGGFAWQTLCDLTGNTENVILRTVSGNSGIGSATKRLKFTLGGSNTSLGYFRIHTIYMANYQAGHNNISGLGLDFTKGVHSLQKYDLNYVWGSFFPAQDNTYDLGSSGYEWKDGYFDGTVYTDGLNVDGNGEADRMTLNGSNFPQLFLIEGSGNSKTLQLGVTGDSAYFKKSDDTGSLIIRNSSNTNVALFSFATGNTTFGGDIIVGPKNNALVEVSESGGSTVKMLAGSVGRVGTYSNHNFIITQNSGDAITIDTSRNATFAGTITSSNLATKNVVLVHGAGGVVGNSGSNSSDSHTWTITHGMGSSRNYKVEVMLNSGNYDTIYPDITRPSDTTIVITFSAAVANSAYKALILKCE